MCTFQQRIFTSATTVSLVKIVQCASLDFHWRFSILLIVIYSVKFKDHNFVCQSIGIYECFEHKIICHKPEFQLLNRYSSFVINIIIQMLFAVLLNRMKTNLGRHFMKPSKPVA